MNRGNGRQTLSELRNLQHLAGAVIMRLLSRRWRMQRPGPTNATCGRSRPKFIKPNDRLTSFERIEIYNRQYWFRLIDSFYDDFPGLRAVLGRLKFNRLAKEYLTQYPSRSFTLRNLGRRLPQFIQDHPALVKPRCELAYEMVRFEWAQVEAFDGAAYPAVSVDDLLGNNPAKLRLALQPYISVLELKYPLDEYVVRLKKTCRAATPATPWRNRRTNIAPNAASPSRGREKFSSSCIGTTIRCITSGSTSVAIGF